MIFICVFVYLRIPVEKIRRARTKPFVNQALQTRDIDACVVPNFKANSAKVNVICSSTFHAKVLLEMTPSASNSLNLYCVTIR